MISEEIIKREYVAIQIMVGIVADLVSNAGCKDDEERDKIINDIAECAIVWSDSLIKKLEETK